MKLAIAAEGVIVQKSSSGVFLRALVPGPEWERRLPGFPVKRQAGSV